MRMDCLVKAFEDGDVEDSEIANCKEVDADTGHLNIAYPTIVQLELCEVPKEYPATAEYKEQQFTPLPALAKGKQDYECTGIQEISTVPNEGSPDTCMCERLTMNGPFSAGALVKCVDCLDVFRSLDKNSCPDGTKLFAPRTR